MDDEGAGAKQQLDRLYAHLVGFAHQTLEKYGEFYPFAATIDRSGEIRQFMAHTGSEHPPSQELIDLTRVGLRRDRANYVAAGLCYDVRIRPTADASAVDAICIALEHEDGLAVTVFEPYAKHGKQVSYAEAFSKRGERITFRP